MATPPNYSTPRPPNHAALGVERFLNDRLREVLGEDDAAEVIAEVDDYSDQMTFVRIADGARLHLGDESDENDRDYWAAVRQDDDQRVAEGPLDSVIEGLRGWITGEDPS
jgi:hypothetical protein